MNIIVVEDHQDLRNTFIDHLVREGYKVRGADCGEQLDELMLEQAVSLLILDINLPGESGLEIAKRIRATYPNINIIMLTVQSAETDRIKGYKSGADMYLAKPVSPSELTAAVHAISRRVQTVTTAAKALEISLAHMTLSAPAGDLALTKNDMALLMALASAPGHFLPYWRLFEITERDLDAEQSKSQLELQIFRLRKKLTEMGVSETLIKSIRREGYKLTELVHIVD